METPAVTADIVIIAIATVTTVTTAWAAAA